MILDCKSASLGDVPALNINSRSGQDLILLLLLLFVPQNVWFLLQYEIALENLLARAGRERRQIKHQGTCFQSVPSQTMFDQ